jgi:hypothetical protein
MKSTGYTTEKKKFYLSRNGYFNEFVFEIKDNVKAVMEAVKTINKCPKVNSIEVDLIEIETHQF